jgi:hypothetical protein
MRQKNHTYALVILPFFTAEYKGDGYICQLNTDGWGFSKPMQFIFTDKRIF